MNKNPGIPDKESGSDRWKVDHIFIDQDSVPTMIEVKRSTDTRVRKGVVGQMLDYAANATRYWPATRMRERFESKCVIDGQDADEVLSEFLSGALDSDEFWKKAEQNLKERRLRLILVADKIPEELQSIVEFLNEQMDHTEVLAIEIKHLLVSGDYIVWLRELSVRPSKAIEVKGSRRRVATNEDDYFDEIEERSPVAAEVARRIFAWANANSTPV